MDNGIYNSPLCYRYASKEMLGIFSNDRKFSTWRKLWVALAESEKELGINITDEQITELKNNVYNIDYEYARQKEKEVRHDVMAHVLTYAKECPNAAKIIHLGATSCYVGDNADILIMKDALNLIKKELVNVCAATAEFALKYKGLPCLAYTHFQAAQPTTVGKRASLWLNDLYNDLNNLNYVIDNLQILGCKGTTGTCASFLELFDNDEEKVLSLENRIAEKMGMSGRVVSVSGQTYSRKTDFAVLSALTQIAISATKFSNDIRLLSHEKEVDEPFEDKQIGSSAMAYKRNPMRSERIASLSRYCITDLNNAAFTASGQWLERTLDDSANKRIAIPEAFLSIDAVLTLYLNVISGLKVYENRIKANLSEEIPFIATENILMRAVNEKGKDRQVLHEKIRELSVATARAMKQDGAKNDLLVKIANDPAFGLSKEELNEITDGANFSGLAEKQTEKFVGFVLKELHSKYSDLFGADAKVEF